MDFRKQFATFIILLVGVQEFSSARRLPNFDKESVGSVQTKTSSHGLSRKRSKVVGSEYLV